MGDSLTTASGILKTDYEGPLGNLINTEHPFLDRLKKKTKGWVGQTLAYGVVTQRNHGARGMNPTSKLPVAGNVGTGQTALTAKTIAGRLLIYQDLINASKNDKGAFVEGIQLSMDNLKESCANQLHRQSFGRKYSISSAYPTGIIAKCTSGAASATQVFDTNHYFEPGRTYAVDTVANIAGTPDYATVSSVSSDGVTVVFTGSITTATNDYAVQYDANGNSYGYELAGTEFMVDNADDNWLGIDTGDHPEWASTVKDNSGTSRPLTLRLMDLTVDAIQIASGSLPDLIVMDPSLRREYVQLLRNDIRFAPGMLNGGDTETSYSHLGKKFEIVTDRYAPYGKMTFLNTSAMDLAERQPWKFMDLDGAVLSRVPDYRAYEATFSWEGDLATNARNKHGKLADLDYSLTA